MIRTTQPIWIFLLAFACVALIGNLPANAFDKGVDFSKVKLMSPDPDDPRYIETEIDGITPFNPLYSDPDKNIYDAPMNAATEAYICPGPSFDSYPDPPGADAIPNLDGCRRVITSTFGAAWNTYVCWGGRWFYIAP